MSLYVGKSSDTVDLVAGRILGFRSMEELVDFFYPVGSYYGSSDGSNPGDKWGGTWVQSTEIQIVDESSAETCIMWHRTA